MPKYKDMLLSQKKQQKELLQAVRQKDPRVDAGLLSKMVNYVCLPIPEQAKVICDYFDCEITELYDSSELLLISQLEKPKPEKPKINRKSTEFNLNVRVERALIERVFSKENMRRLGIVDKSSAIRSFILQLDRKLARMNAKEKASKKED